jgi:RimJ/RimL family protein N-acetyltransferase
MTLLIIIEKYSEINNDEKYGEGFHISSKYRRQGFAFEASSEVIKYAFYQLGVSRLFAGHNPKNETSGRLLIKLGFQYSHNEFYPPTGLNHPSYFLEKDDYINRQNRNVT